MKKTLSQKSKKHILVKISFSLLGIFEKKNVK